MLAPRLLVLGVQGGDLFPLSFQARHAFALFPGSRIFAECVSTICPLLNEFFLVSLWAALGSSCPCETVAPRHPGHDEVQHSRLVGGV